jgi:hypothetical protein
MDTHTTYNHLNAAICTDCRSSDRIKKKYLYKYYNNPTVNDMLNIVPGKFIKITYTVSEETHDGYCSDHTEDDVTCTRNLTELVLPLMDGITENEKLFRYFYTPHNQPTCGLGCTQKTFEIIDYPLFVQRNK